MIYYHENFDVIKNVKSNAIIAHGVNCLGVMGAGIALQIKKTYPNVYNTYARWVKQNEGQQDLLGTCAPVPTNTEDQLYIANCFTQRGTGFANGKPPATLQAIRESLEQAASFAYNLQYDIWMPKIGCGLGGLVWEDVEKIVEEISEEYSVDFHICTL